MEAEAFLSRWEQLAEFCCEELMRDRAESALLGRLRPFPRAAVHLVTHLSTSPDHRRRQVAAIVAGLVDDIPPGLLDELFERESERNALSAPETTQPLCCQSVVEDIVLSSSRRCRRERSRDDAFALLRKIVERTLVGEYWSSAVYALTTLCRHQAPGHAELLRLFSEFAGGSPPNHPLRPSLATERWFAEGLSAGAAEVLEAIELRLSRDSAAAAGGMLFDPDTEAAIEAWLEEARRLG